MSPDLRTVLQSFVAVYALRPEQRKAAEVLLAEPVADESTLWNAEELVAECQRDREKLHDSICRHAVACGVSVDSVRDELARMTNIPRHVLFGPSESKPNALYYGAIPRMYG